MRAAPWTKERVEIVKQLWADGATARSIADRLGGITRSAVMGKIFRLRRGAATAALAPPGQGKAAADDSAQPAAPAAPARRRRGGKRRVRVLQPTGRAGGKSLLELTNETCRWPHGRPGTRAFFFCGAPGADLESGMPYCARHAQLAYRSCAGAGEGESPAIVPAADLGAISQPAPARRSVWRPTVRHPAARWR